MACGYTQHEAGVSYYIPASTGSALEGDPWPYALPCCHPSFVRASFAADRTSSLLSLRTWINGFMARLSRISPRAAAAYFRTTQFSSLRAWINGSTARVSLISPRASAAVFRTARSVSLRAWISGSTALVSLIFPRTDAASPRTIAIVIL
jgi:hypothetical protein